MFGGPEAKETAVFTDIFDKYFDALNVCNFTDGKHQRKPFKNPYRSGTDFRLKVKVLMSYIIYMYSVVLTDTV